jgi:hypothetical protein
MLSGIVHVLKVLFKFDWVLFGWWENRSSHLDIKRYFIYILFEQNLGILLPMYIRLPLIDSSALSFFLLSLSSQKSR